MKQLILLFIFSFSLVISFAQETPKDSTKSNDRPLFLIKKSDGNEIYGYIISDDGREILLETKTIGKLYINKSDIKEIIAIDGNKENLEYGEYRTTGPFTTRYFFTTNALPVKKKENYAMLHLYGPEVHFALNDNLNLGVMSSWLGSPIGLAAKYSFPSKSKTHFALGGIFASSGYLLDAQAFGGLHWATLTQGDRMSNISFSIGYAYADMGSFASNSYLGNEYCYGNYDYYYYGNNYECSKYQIVDYEAYSAVQSKVGRGKQFYRNSFNDALAIGLGGITPVGNKASFIFDAMFFINSKDVLEYSDYVVTVTYDKTDYSTSWPYTITTVTETYTIGKGTLKKNAATNYTLVIMPGMRFNKSYDQAFQIALAGFILVNEDRDVFTFPAPMITWLRKF